MAIRVVDMALPIQRGAEFLANQRGDARVDAQQQEFAARLSKEQEIKEQQVQETPRPEDAQVHEDGRGRGGAYERGKQKKKNKTKQEAKSKQLSSSMFDITI